MIATSLLNSFTETSRPIQLLAIVGAVIVYRNLKEVRRKLHRQGITKNVMALDFNISLPLNRFCTAFIVISFALKRTLGSLESGPSLPVS